MGEGRPRRRRRGDEALAKAAAQARPSTAGVRRGGRRTAPLTQTRRSLRQAARFPAVPRTASKSGPGRGVDAAGRPHRSDRTSRTRRSYGAPTLKRILADPGCKHYAALLVCVGDHPRKGHATTSLADFGQSIATTTMEKIMRFRANALAARDNQEAGVEATPDPNFDHLTAHRRRGNKCGHCGKSCGNLCCAACGQVRYCDRVCQKRHWKEHKGPCARRLEAVARMDEMSQRLGCLETGHDTVKRLSDGAVEKMGTREQQEEFLVKYKEFDEKFARSGLLADFVFDFKDVKMSGAGMGDDEATVEAKGKAWERKIRIHLDHSDYVDFKRRYFGGSRTKGRVNLKMIMFDEADIPDMAPRGVEFFATGPRRRRGSSARRGGVDPAQVTQGIMNKTASKMHLDLFAKLDPRTHFLCTLTDRNLGPMMDATMFVPWASRVALRGDAWREPRIRDP